MKKLLILLLVLGLASAASAVVNVTEDFEPTATTVGALNGQNGGTGWSAAWSGSGSYSVLSETSNQYYSNAYAGTKDISRGITAFSDRQFTVSLFVRMGSRQNTWGTGTPCELQLREGSVDPIHLKFEPGNETFRCSGNWLVDYGQIADDANSDDGALKDLYAGWVGIKLKVDMTEETIDVYWEQNDGDMQWIAQTGLDNTATATIDYLKTQTRTGGEGSEFELDNLAIIPEPATIMLLGLGGFALIRRKR